MNPRASKRRRLSLPLTGEHEDRLGALAETMGAAITSTNVAVMSLSLGLHALEAVYLGRPLPMLFEALMRYQHEPAEEPAPPSPPRPRPDPRQDPGAALAALNAMISPPKAPQRLRPPQGPQQPPPPPQPGPAPLAPPPAVPGPYRPTSAHSQVRLEPMVEDPIPDAPVEASESETDRDNDAIPMREPAPAEPSPRERVTAQDAIRERLAELLEQGVPIEDAYEMARRKTAQTEEGATVTQLFGEAESPEDVDPFVCTHGVRFDAPVPCGACVEAGF